MALNKPFDEIKAEGDALAEELGCYFRITPSFSNPNEITMGFKPLPKSGSFTFNFQLTFASHSDTSPSSVWLRAFNDNYPVLYGMDTDPASITTFADVEAIMRGLFVAKDNVQIPKQKKVPASALTLTYDQLDELLSLRASMSNDMHADAHGEMIVTAYSDTYDERHGININLIFRVLETETDEEEPSIALIGAEREANDHEWEAYSSKKVGVRNIKTVDDLLAMLEKQIKPKEKKPKL